MTLKRITLAVGIFVAALTLATLAALNDGQDGDTGLALAWLYGAVAGNLAFLIPLKEDSK